MLQFPETNQSKQVYWLLVGQMASLFVCEFLPGVSQTLHIKTPFLLPDGDSIDVFYHLSDEGAATLTDLGKTVTWLRTRIASEELSTWHLEKISDLCVTYQLTFANNALSLRLTHAIDLASGLFKFAQGVLAIAVAGDIL